MKTYLTKPGTGLFSPATFVLPRFGMDRPRKVPYFFSISLGSLGTITFRMLHTLRQAPDFQAWVASLAA